MKLEKVLLGATTLIMANCALMANNAIICSSKGNAATIVLSNTASKNTEYAAKELQLLLGKITGQQFNISKQEVPGTKIYLDKHPNPAENKKVKNTSFAITNNGNLSDFLFIKR